MLGKCPLVFQGDGEYSGSGEEAWAADVTC